MPLEIHALPGAQPLLPALARRILTQHRATLPDLSDVLVLCPQAAMIGPLQTELLSAAEQMQQQAVFGMQITTLGAWAADQAAHLLPQISGYERELVLLNELRHHPALFGSGNPWTLTDNLLTLFDDLTREQISFPGDAVRFQRQLQTAYGIASTPPPPLEEEARLVHTLWRAWHEHLSSHRLQDQASAFVAGLRQGNDEPRQRQIYLAGFHELPHSVWQWLQQASQQLSLTWLLHWEPDLHRAGPPARAQTLTDSRLTGLDRPASPVAELLAAALQTDPAPLRQRALHFKAQYPQSPLTGKVHCAASNGGEHQAHTVCRQVLHWLQAGVGQIAVVSEDRKLARRLRALLERHTVAVADASGWALSTTQAAAVLERWLQTVEEDFFHQPLLDLLKSPFLRLSADRETYLYLIHRFERDIVRNANIPRGLARLRRQLQLRRSRLGDYPHTADDLDLDTLLATLGTAAAPLQACLQDAHPLHQILSHLLDSLRLLGIADCYAGDAAGQRILQELDLMQEAARRCPIQLTWLEFRAWLGYALERYNFVPPAPAAQVQLLNLRQTLGCHYEAVVIAGAEQDSYPGAVPAQPFFNDRVRRALRLPCAEDHYRSQFYLFSRLLLAADRVLITYRRQEGGEDIVCSPWVSLLQTFHRLAYDDDLQQPAPPPAPVAPLDAPAPRRPAPTVPVALLPPTLSAGGYQSLLDCPYKFFATRCLGLKAPETVSEVLDKADYGSHIHRCLEAFHKGVRGIAGPFAQPLDDANLAQAQQLLETISEQVFFADLEDNFLHRLWLARWRRLIPVYLQWQLEHQQAGFRFVDAEVNCPAQGPAPLAPMGRIDRVDRGADGLAIIDYKTGAVPDRKSLASGEAAQLYYYAMLAQAALNTPVRHALYLKLDGGEIEPVPVKTDTLDDMVENLRQQLAQCRDALCRGQALPAWGDVDTCAYCEFAGLCRRDFWEEEEAV